MTRAKLLAILASVVLILTLPSIASAQQPPQSFVGTASIDGAPAPEGTVVAAWVAGAEAASTTAGGGGAYSLLVDEVEDSFPGETVTFTIGGNAAGQSAAWTPGAFSELDLTASSVPPTPTATPRPPATATPVPTPVPAATGVPGATGQPGQLGERGPTGRTGRTGPEGPEGPEGPQGSLGDEGPGGLQGPQGVQGDAGPEGSGGNRGQQGAAGPAGKKAKAALWASWP